MKSLTIKGFKSFARPTTFDFEPGVTAIVGPNGSGKSNVVDALAWVMGEQGAKTLRGGKMEDVIFAGTEARGPLGRAEVKLTIDNADGALPIEYSEVTISRTLFRSGASDYAINGETCRLLDVQELLSDSGLGREMHVIVGQGQLDAVLRATPEDRRGFIEEAAGILKHRRRKERTLRKLDGMEANLTRLQDLAGEIRRQLKPLGRQAEVAREAQHIAADVRDAKARLLADDVTQLRHELDGLTQVESERHAERIVLQEQHDHKQQRVTLLEHEQSGEALDTARRITVGLEGVQQQLRGLYTQAQQRLTFLATQAEAPDQSGRLTQSVVDDAAAETARLSTLVPTAEAAWREAQSASLKARAQVDALDEQIAELSALVSQHDLALSQLRGRAEAAGQKHATLAQELTRRTQALAQAEERAEAAQAALDAFVRGAAGDDASDTAGGSGEQGSSDQLTPEQLTPEQLEAAHRAAQEAQVACERARDAARDELHAIEQERAGLEARVTALTRLLEARDASGALLGAAQPGITGRVADHVRVRDGFEAAVGAALGANVDALLATTLADATAAVDTARDGDLGTVRTVIAAPLSDASARECSAATTQQTTIARSLGATPLADTLLDAPDGVRALLARSYAVEHLTAAAQLAEALGAVTASAASDTSGQSNTLGGDAGTGYLIVTAAGDVLTPHTLTGGSGHPPSTIELAAELEQAAASLARVREAAETAATALTEHRERAQQAKRDVHAAYARLREADARAAETAKQRNQLTARAESAHAEAERVAQSITLVQTEAAQAEASLAEATRALDAAAEEPRPVLDVSQRDAFASALDTHRATELEQRLALETARERVRAATARARELGIQLEAERRAADEAARREVLRARQVDRATRVAHALPAIIDACDRSVAEAREAQQQAEAEWAGRNHELTQLRAQEAELRTKLARLTEQAHNSELKSYERRLHLASLVERANGELGLTEAVLLAEYGPDQPIPVEAGDEADTAESAAARPASGKQPRARLPAGFASQLEAELAAELGLQPAGSGSFDAEASAPRAPGTAHPASIPYVRAEQERRLAAAEKKLSRLGRINPLALEEFAALEQRHQFLSDQLQDLTKTRADLLAIISDLDVKMQGIFAAAFEDTRAAFAEVFPILFPGGTGEVSLTEPGNLLATGIDIVVRPAGKKVERMSLLSGGERSLAAVAWLVAIFQARPSPFYIVDEVEAALDDANLGRLLLVFERLRENSQLIIITHQKRTMEIADALYGVSMRQDGISQVVGQRVGREDA
nr:chromosome segregation protein SMC [Leucobacter exalbidus]